MRRHAPYYDSETDTWGIIFNEDYEQEWYNMRVTVKSQFDARGIADALNRG